MVICSTWLLGSGTLPTRMSRAVSMRRLVSVSSMGYPLAFNYGEFAIVKIGIVDALQCSQNLDAQFLGIAHALLLVGELIQGHVVFDVIGYERAILRRQGSDVAA